MVNDDRRSAVPIWARAASIPVAAIVVTGFFLVTADGVERTGHELPGSVSLAGVAGVEAAVAGDPRGPVRDLLVTRRGVVAVFDDEIALYETDTAAQVWSHRRSGPWSAGLTADGKRIVLAREGGILPGTRWTVLDAVTGETVASHRSDTGPEELTSMLTSRARVAFTEDGGVQAFSLDTDEELWEAPLDGGCTDTRGVALAWTVVVAAACEGEVRLLSVEAETGSLTVERSWAGTRVPELALLTERTVPGGPDDPVESVITEDLAEEYALFAQGGVVDSLHAGAYLPERAVGDRPPSLVVVAEDRQDARARMILRSGRWMLEEGVVEAAELEARNLLVDGRLPVSLDEWDGDPRIMISILDEVLTDALSEE